MFFLHVQIATVAQEGSPVTDAPSAILPDVALCRYLPRVTHRGALVRCCRTSLDPPTTELVECVVADSHLCDLRRLFPTLT